jgi:hypothetical protein
VSTLTTSAWLRRARIPGRRAAPLAVITGKDLNEDTQRRTKTHKDTINQSFWSLQAMNG